MLYIGYLYVKERPSQRFQIWFSQWRPWVRVIIAFFLGGPILAFLVFSVTSDDTEP